MTTEKNAPESDAARSDPSTADENREQLRKNAEKQLDQSREKKQEEPK